MATKFIIFFGLVALSQAGILAPQQGWAAPQHGWAAPAIIKKVVAVEEPANYEFNYEVHEEKTGDIKRQNEKAVNGVISGQYSLIDADGFRRVVEYTADDHNGFVANVRREPLHEQHKKIIVQQPVIKYIQAAKQW
jgi:Insect cuticle protein